MTCIFPLHSLGIHARNIKAYNEIHLLVQSFLSRCFSFFLPLTTYLRPDSAIRRVELGSVLRDRVRYPGDRELYIQLETSKQFVAAFLNTLLIFLRNIATQNHQKRTRKPQRGNGEQSKSRQKMRGHRENPKNRGKGTGLPFIFAR